MNELFVPVIVAAAAVLITALLCAAALSAWRGWLTLRHAQMRQEPADGPDAQPIEAHRGTGALIEIAAVKERLRRLEAIASGVEL